MAVFCRCWYVLWTILVFCVLPAAGRSGLLSLHAFKSPLIALVSNLSNLTDRAWLYWVARGFIVLAILTSLIGISKLASGDARLIHTSVYFQGATLYCYIDGLLLYGWWFVLSQRIHAGVDVCQHHCHLFARVVRCDDVATAV